MLSLNCSACLTRLITCSTDKPLQFLLWGMEQKAQLKRHPLEVYTGYCVYGLDEGNNSYAGYGVFSISSTVSSISSSFRNTLPFSL